MPLLWNAHFLVMWYEKLTNQLTIYNSVEGFDPDLLSAVQKKFVKLLSTFCTSEPLLKTDRLVLQSDTSSCIACVCYAIDAVATGILNVLYVYEPAWTLKWWFFILPIYACK